MPSWRRANAAKPETTEADLKTANDTIDTLRQQLADARVEGARAAGQADALTETVNMLKVALDRAADANGWRERAETATLRAAALEAELRDCRLHPPQVPGWGQPARANARPQ